MCEGISVGTQLHGRARAVSPATGQIADRAVVNSMTVRTAFLMTTPALVRL